MCKGNRTEIEIGRIVDETNFRIGGTVEVHQSVVYHFWLDWVNEIDYDQRVGNWGVFEALQRRLFATTRELIKHSLISTQNTRSKRMITLRYNLVINEFNDVLVDVFLQLLWVLGLCPVQLERLQNLASVCSHQLPHKPQFQSVVLLWLVKQISPSNANNFNVEPFIAGISHSQFTVLQRMKLQFIRRHFDLLPLN